MTRLIYFFGLAATLILLVASNSNAESSPEVSRLLQNARSQIGQTLHYDGSYRALAYPGGDVPLDRGVCTDVLIRSYRKLGVDLQKLVHEDMGSHFAQYPSRKIWKLSKPDRNIDHRRVPNLQIFFKRHGTAFGVDLEGHPPQPGDLLTWELPGNLPHIGIVSDRKVNGDSAFLVIHNIGEGTKEEAVINRYKLTGHYRYAPWVRGD